MSRHLFSPSQQKPAFGTQAAFLDCDDDDEGIPVLGESLISNQLWRSYDPCTAHHLAVGDFGFVPPGEGVESFVNLGNIFSDELAALPVEETALGVQWDETRRHPSVLPYSTFSDSLAWLVINSWFSLGISDDKFKAGL
jgi:hypothetical protein